MKKATSIEIRWDDGSTSSAQGENAAKIMDWYGSCETMNLIHGAVYKGPKFTESEPAAQSSERAE